MDVSVETLSESTQSHKGGIITLIYQYYCIKNTNRKIKVYIEIC